jgi:hypothetical protein
MAMMASAACIGVTEANICNLSSATMVKAATRIAAITNIRTTMHVWQVEPRFGVCFDKVSIIFLLWFVSWQAVPSLTSRRSLQKLCQNSAMLWEFHVCFLTAPLLCLASVSITIC